MSNCTRNEWRRCQTALETSVYLANDRDADKVETAYEKWAPDYWTAVKAPEPSLAAPEAAFAVVPVDGKIKAHIFSTRFECSF